MKVVMYMRPGCHLCDGARESMRALGIVWEEVDIDSDPALQADYLLRIPVIEAGGRVVAEGNLSEVPLAELLRPAARS